MIFTEPRRKIFESKHNKISYKNTQIYVSQCTLDFESRAECRLECREYDSIHIVDSNETILCYGRISYGPASNKNVDIKFSVHDAFLE